MKCGLRIQDCSIMKWFDTWLGSELYSGEGLAFEPTRLRERWARERREEAESLADLGMPVKRAGARKPRLALDEKLQKLLGHFQKDYEGGVCAENSGSQMGGYGSFLYPQRSLSVISQSRSPAVPPNHGNASRSPYVPVESAQKSHFVKTELDSRGKDDYCRRTSNGINGNPHQQILNRAVNGPEQKAPKIRIKVNSSRSLARNTAAVYSGLGLDISPSSSMDDSLGGSAGDPEPKNLPDASPHTILQIMTCHPIPGGLLLSPLADNIMALRKKTASVTKEHEAPEFDYDKAELNRDWCPTTSAAGDNKNKVSNKNKYVEKKDHLPSIKNSQCRHNDSTIVNKGTMHQLLDMSDDAGSVLLPRSMKTEQHSVEESEKLVADIPNHLKETKNGPLKARGMSLPYLIRKRIYEARPKLGTDTAASSCGTGNKPNQKLV
ncbi:cysteine-tryptophan domain-containing zinc finger protein 5-like isoform X2 [Lolium rigidum]|uniref:cysteine-tryptophan domain-containing zinc finger protein 5-like isoform X2 n=1 Tax=Lolium rigidum TaxID=89674 RepID=UPI001F5D957B|nr:cysteine-tryptophan domain-containing zinc finger protein 5-like isoform X2 [Lolium rigidum]XP_047054003.1 cysteine-tryptophan domain-containing zinc finger protein 5-like isoform X2 [Lolium rigidum]XP_047054004.1 cysteine-tryptophan domain-containing zinc finger protein 5-like isoform X2 [Lolium rigidum]XP_047054005.1 cysteine-tryptophan domain-containing zinc finger protein 5-like isoform X2 [Lolium rigidum]